MDQGPAFRGLRLHRSATALRADFGEAQLATESWNGGIRLNRWRANALREMPHLAEAPRFPPVDKRPEHATAKQDKRAVY